MQNLIASLIEPNYFQSNEQYLGRKGGLGTLRIPGVRFVQYGTVFNKIAPAFIGEMVICQEQNSEDSSKEDFVVYMGYALENTGWIKLGEKSQTKPALNFTWSSGDRWSDDNKWIHYANSEPRVGTWSHKLKWDDENAWFIDTPDPTIHSVWDGEDTWDKDDLWIHDKRGF